MPKTVFFFHLFILLFFYSCTEKLSKKQFGLSATGKVGEIMVVCDQAIWESEIKKELDSQLTQFILPYFPDVATFEIKQRTTQEFKKGHKQWRNLLILSIDPKCDESEIIKEVDTYAESQLLIKIVAKNYNELLDICKHNLNKVHQLFDDMEWKRLALRYKEETNNQILSSIKKNFGFALVLPNGSKIVSKRDNFFRIEFPLDSKPIEFDRGFGQSASFTQSGLLIYQYPFSDSTQFELKNLLQARDTMLKYNVPHDVKGVYMGTQYHPLVYPEINTMWNMQSSLLGKEMRGMFQFLGKGDFKTGGAFWSFHFLNKNNKMVCVSGYVDAPPTVSWTYPLRKVQAVLKSISL
ncbi:MAG: DUF4837 family protein [Flavobacteriia bacterium]|nr:DUF4837 family protein [Flavobacteriia bacterium]